MTWDHANQYLEFNKDIFSNAHIIGTTGTKVGRIINAAGVFNVEAYTTRQISFGNVDNGEHVRIDADGNVGIGLTSPSELLHVKGTNGAIAIDGNGSSNTASIKFINDNERSRITSAYDSGGGGRLTFHTDTTGGSLVERVRIDNAGRLLAGTSSPGARSAHTFARTGAFAAEVLQQQTSAGASVLGLTYDGAAPNNTTDYFIYAKDTASIKHLVRANGAGYFADNVGIGIQTPTLVTGKIVHIHGGAAGVHLTDTSSGSTSGDGAYFVFDNPNAILRKIRSR